MKYILFAIVAVTLSLSLPTDSVAADGAINIVNGGIHFTDGSVQTKAAVLPGCINGGVLVYNSDSWYCGSVIPVTNGVATCIGAQCRISACLPKTADCDGTLANGCESDLNSSTLNCGACGNICNEFLECINGECKFSSIVGKLLDTVSSSTINGAVVRVGWGICTTDLFGNFNLGTAPYCIVGLPCPDNIAIITTQNATYNPTYFRQIITTAPNYIHLGKPNSSINGLVANLDGSPAVGAEVKLTYIFTLNSGAIYTTTSTKSIVTDANGAYTISTVESGSSISITTKSANGLYTKAVGNVTLPAIENYSYNAALITLDLPCTHKYYKI